MLNFCEKLFYHNLEFTITPCENVKISGWVGAVLRNNLLYACEQIRQGEEDTLLRMINSCPLSPEHPLFKPLSGGFPKCFSLLLNPNQVIPGKDLYLQAGEEFKFNLVILGESSRFYREFIQAVKLMCERGIGHPMIPFDFISAIEKNPWGRGRKIAVGGSQTTDVLKHPVYLADFRQERFGERDICIGLDYVTPVLLFNPGVRQNKEVSYQDKLNGFPGFYQFIRSTASRCVKLAALYAAPDDISGYNLAQNELQEFPDAASEAFLMQTNLKYVSFQGSKRGGTKDPIIFRGYLGRSTYGGDFTDYIPFLRFMENLGTGNDTVYGLGNFKIEVINTK